MKKERRKGRKGKERKEMEWNGIGFGCRCETATFPLTLPSLHTFFPLTPIGN